MEHCIDKITVIVAQGQGDRRSVFQLGYNLGRLSELARGGKEAFWDRWKDPVSTWNQEELERLARDLRQQCGGNDTSPE
jgi:hypothetical protein